jgi:hypothetical protein
MASASSLAHFDSSKPGDKGLETIEIDPQYAQGLGLNQGDTVCPLCSMCLRLVNGPKFQGRNWASS